MGFCRTQLRKSDVLASSLTCRLCNVCGTCFCQFPSVNTSTSALDFSISCSCRHAHDIIVPPSARVTISGMSVPRQSLPTSGSAAGYVITHRYNRCRCTVCRTACCRAISALTESGPLRCHVHSWRNHVMQARREGAAASRGCGQAGGAPACAPGHAAAAAGFLFRRQRRPTARHGARGF